MGRPPLKLDLEMVHVRLPKSAIARIDAMVGNYERSKFIREAVENELKRREG